MANTTALGSIVDWLKAGYPDGVPDQDYIPLLALLARRLTNDEVADVADQLKPTSPSSDGRSGVTDSDIRSLITQITNEPPRREDMARVRAQLDTAGPFL